MWNVPGGGTQVSDRLGIRVNQGSGSNKVGNFSLSLHQSTQVTARWTRGVNHCSTFGDMRYTLHDVTSGAVAIASTDRIFLEGISYMLRHETGGATKRYAVYAYDLQGGTPVLLSNSDHLVAIPDQSTVDGH